MIASVSTRKRKVSRTTAGTARRTAKTKSEPRRRRSFFMASHSLPEEAARRDEQDEVEDGEDGEQRVARVEVDEEDRLQDAEEERCRRDAREVAHARQHDDEEREDGVLGAHLRG